MSIYLKAQSLANCSAFLHLFTGSPLSLTRSTCVLCTAKTEKKNSNKRDPEHTKLQALNFAGRRGNRSIFPQHESTGRLFLFLFYCNFFFTMRVYVCARVYACLDPGGGDGVYVCETERNLLQILQTAVHLSDWAFSWVGAHISGFRPTSASCCLPFRFFRLEPV